MANVKFSEGDARRIAAATRAYERGNRDMAPVRFRDPGGDGGDPIRIGKVGADWAFGTCATVTLWERDAISGAPCQPTLHGEVSGVFSPPTVEGVRNLSRDVKANSWVAIAQAADGKWYLVEAGSPVGTCRQTIGGEDITKWPGWDGAKVQLLGHDANGCLKWFDSEECEETSPGTP